MTLNTLLTRTLLAADGELADGEWGDSDCLFALAGDPDGPRLRYLLQNPRPMHEVLPALVRLGLHAEPDTLGLVVMTTGPDGVRALMGVTTGGGLIRVVTRCPAGATSVSSRLPSMYGDHEVLVDAARRFLGRDVSALSQRSFRLLAAG